MFHARTEPPHPARSPLCILHLWGTALQPKALEGAGRKLHPCQVSQWVQDGCPQQAGEDATEAALIFLQGRGCAGG